MVTKRGIVFTCSATLLFSLIACSASTTADPKSDGSSKNEKHVAIVTEKLEPYECGSITRLHTLGGVFLGSQPNTDDLKQAKESGVKTVINLRLADEVKEFDEKELVEQLGLEYFNPGFKTPDQLTDQIFDEVRSSLMTADKKPILLHCSSANRVGAVWLAHRVLDGGLSYEEALSEAKIVGLKLPAYEEKARSYIERNKKAL